MTSLLHQYLTRFNHVKLAFKEKKGPPKDMADHFKQRVSEGRGGIDPSKQKSFNEKIERLTRRMNASPELIEATSPEGKRYTATAENVKKLPNQIGLRVPGVDGFVVLENRNPPHMNPNYTMNTIRDTSMGLRAGTVEMTEKGLMRRLIPGAFPKKPKTPKAKKISPELAIRERYGYTGNNWRARWGATLKEIGSKRDGLNAAREALGEKPLPPDAKITSLKPGPRADLPHLSVKKGRRLTRAVLALSSKGKLKLGFANALRNQPHLLEALALGYSHRSAFSSLR